MQLAKVRLSDGTVREAWVDGEDTPSFRSGYVSQPDPVQRKPKRIRAVRHGRANSAPLNMVKFLPPIDGRKISGRQASPTFVRRTHGNVNRRGAARFYDLVYSADRPTFFKAPANRVVPTGEPVNIRKDSKWNVPEPELALVISPKLKLIGFTIGNDMIGRTSKARIRCTSRKRKSMTARRGLRPRGHVGQRHARTRQNVDQPDHRTGRPKGLRGDHQGFEHQTFLRRADQLAQQRNVVPSRSGFAHRHRNRPS